VLSLKLMIPLNKEAWSTLNHAYGRANDIPALLLSAEADPSPKSSNDQEPWFSLWSALCHQGDVYSASFAAVPHLLRIAKTAVGPCAWDLLGLPISIELARVHSERKVCPELEGNYQLALRELPEIVALLLPWEWDYVFTQAATAALALSKRHLDLAEAIMELGPTAAKAFLKNSC